MIKIFWAVGLLVVFIDQITKWIVGMLGHEIVLNRGVSWGWGQNVDSGLLIVAIYLSLLFIAIQSKNLKSRQEVLFWGCLWGGGVGNLVDRLFWGYVRDWIVIVSWFPWFNIADVAVSAAIGGILVNYIYGYFRSS